MVTMQAQAAALEHTKRPDVVITELHPDHDTSKPPAKPITLALNWYVTQYKVAAISDTTWYKPGHWMTPEVAQKLCDLPGWTVNMSDNDLLSALTGLAVGALGKAVTVPALGV